MRDLLFVGLLGGGLLAVIASLMPPQIAKTNIADAGIVTQHNAQLRPVVDRVNQSLRKSASGSGQDASQLTDPLQICRRLSLGLMGTLPSLEEIRRIESMPKSERIGWWLEHILADRRSADYLAERMGRAYVGTEGGPFIFFRRRRFVSWLADNLAQNRPYDQLVRDLIADNGLWTDRPATNFVSVTSQPDKENQPDPVRLAGRVTRAFLGLRLDCAQCHDHPFASWVKADFEGLSAFFGQTHIGFKGIFEGDGEYELFDRKSQTPRVIAPQVPFASELVPANGNRREQLATWITHPNNPYFARAAVNRIWALLLGRPLVEPVDNLPAEGQVPEALQILADDFSVNGFDLRRLVRVIASTDVFQRDSGGVDIGDGAGETSWASFPLTRLRPEQVAGAVLQASSVSTINAQTHLLGRLIRYGEMNEFIARYGDDGEDEFDARSGTIPQRLLMMNGKLVRENIAGLNTSPRRVAWLAPDDPRAIEAIYLAALTRRPTTEELEYFERQLRESPNARIDRLQDIFWALINSTEFSWNH
jgi:hypothetical protein